MLNSIIMAVVTSITVAACTQTETATETVSEKTSETISSALIKIQNIFSENNFVSDIQYQLSYNENFPCQVAIDERSENTGIHWLKQYQFDLTDINTNSFIQSKPDRRAIIYTSTRHTPNTDEKKFKSIKINNFSLRTNVTEINQRLIITEINKAIALCEEEYSFEESEIETP